MRVKYLLKNVAQSVAILTAAACASHESSKTIEASAGGVVAASISTGVTPAFRLTVEQPGNEVRYRVREQLVGRDLPNDAVGVTQAVTGEILFAEDGTVIPDGSRLTIDVTSLKSDQNRRDTYVRNRLLETAKFPTVVFEPNFIRGAPKALPTSGSTAFSLLGNLTIKSVTRPATWFVSAKFAATNVTGTASTAFSFADFGISQPSVPVLLSVADTIKLEYDYSFVVKK
jgi:polyisoprenoid-binding protein YceI